MHWKLPSDNSFSSMKLPAGSFSWSMRRRKMFELCKRAYFYHYYGASGGWDIYAPEAQRRLYLLKKIRRAEEWAVDLFSEGIRNLVSMSRSSRKLDVSRAAQFLSGEMNRIYRRGCFDILSENWRTDHKALNLFEIYYDRRPGQDDRVLEYVRQRIAQLCGNMVRHPLFPVIAGLDKLQLRSVQNPTSFMLGDLEVWVAPLLVWRDEDRLKILAVRSGDPPDRRDLALSAGLFQMMAVQLYHVAAEKVDVIYYYTGLVNQPPQMVLVEQAADEAAVVAAVSSDSHEMLSLVLPGDFVREKDFPGWLTAAEPVCTGCCFREFCHSEEPGTV